MNSKQGLIIIIVLMMGASLKDARADCKFLNGKGKAVIYHTIDDINMPLVAIGGGHKNILSLSTIASSLGASSSSEPVLNCDGGEYIIIGDSSSPLDSSSIYLVPGGKDFSTYSQFDNTHYPVPTIGDYQSPVELIGDLSVRNILNVPSNSSITPVVYSYRSTTASAHIESYKAFSVRTTSGLEILDVYINEFNIKRNSGCAVSLSTSSFEVSLGEVLTKKLQSQGDTSNNTGFDISLSCNETSVSITFDGNFDEQTAVFKNTTGEGYAENIGIRLLRENSVISPQMPFYLDSYQVSDYTGAYKAYKFSAEYYRLSGAITPGDVDIPVTFTLTYE